MKKFYIFYSLVFIFITTSSFAQYTKLYDFTASPGGNSPNGSPLYISGYLYGMTFSGGANNFGIIFKIKTDGTGFLKLHDFAGAADGKWPQGDLYYDGTFLYGMTTAGGDSSSGVLFKIKPDGTGFLKILNFHSTANGGSPYGSLISDGTFLYGTTSFGGANSYGALFKIKPDGTGFVKLYDFVGGTDGANPHGSLVSDGTFMYGTTTVGGDSSSGTIFRIKPDGTGYLKLLNFHGVANGANPQGSLMLSSSYLYGTAANGGTTSNFGTVYKIKTDGTGFLKLKDFTGPTTGSHPYGNLYFDGTSVYGTTVSGGTTSDGVLFKIKTDGTLFQRLFNFTAAPTGANPFGSFAFDGTFLYGLTNYGGANSYGVIFKYGFGIGINELEDINSRLTVYPNPAKDDFTIRLDVELKNGKLEIINSIGEKVYSSDLNTKLQTLSTKLFPAGIYFVRVTDGEKKYTQKLIIE